MAPAVAAAGALYKTIWPVSILLGTARSLRDVNRRTTSVTCRDFDYFVAVFPFRSHFADRMYRREPEDSLVQRELQAKVLLATRPISRGKMLRRVVTALLVLVLPIQGIALPHSHAGTEPAGHDRLAHWHLSFACVPWICDHDDETDVLRHGHGHRYGHRHSHRHDSEDIDDQPANPEGNRESVPVGHHDDDAAYLPDAVVTGKVSRLIQDSASMPFGFFMPGPDLYAPDIPSLRVPRTLGPPVGRFCCPIYLQTLSLLI